MVACFDVWLHHATNIYIHYIAYVMCTFALFIICVHCVNSISFVIIHSYTSFIYMNKDPPTYFIYCYYNHINYKRTYHSACMVSLLFE